MGKSSKKPLTLTLLHSERPKFHAILAFLSAIGLTQLAFIISKAKGAKFEFMTWAAWDGRGDVGNVTIFFKNALL